MAKMSTVIYRQLQAALRAGAYPAGTRLPGERALSADLQVSRATVRAALAHLEADGAVARSAQRGWFVPHTWIGEPPSTLTSFSEMAFARGLRPTAQILGVDRRPATLEESERLQLAPTSPVVELTRLRGMDAMPVCVDKAVLPLPMAAPLLDLNLTDRSLYEVLHTACGVVIYRSAYSLVAQGATKGVAELLRVESGWPLLVGTETTYATNGTPINLGLVQYRGDAYRFQTDLYR